ncbi:MAG TPA: hypothetical protein P5205_16800 [Candidatus Paceibacterota bacterium]|nr:hypothetical protein [Verrucomicrobiota bacterium]HSA12022.1 hypothetical protein [Candidatus Paceibacterota bacterium]
MKLIRLPRFAVLLGSIFLLSHLPCAAESPFLYGIFDGGDPDPADASEYLGHISSGAGPGWVTVTVSIGANTNDTWGKDYRFLSNLGHTVIGRINHGYFPIGTIPLTNKYDDFAIRCASFVTNSQGCSIWTIGNELNIAGEWPFDTNRNVAPFVTPGQYALCYRKVYNAIKAVRPNHIVLPQAPACFSGPFSAGSNPYGLNNFPYESNPLTWVQYLNQMLTAITTTGPNPRPPDGIALHLASRGYTCSAIHSTAKIGSLYSSFYVYQDWVNLGIPSSLYNLPLYATECNGYYFWKGGHHESPLSHYEPGWMQEVYAEISRYNQTAVATGKPVYRCVNMYQWPEGYDNWNINGSSDFFKDDILADLDIAVAQRYTWPGNYAGMLIPIGINFIHPGTSDDTVPICGNGGVVPQTGWINLTAGGTGSGVALQAGLSVSWFTPGGGTHEFSTLPNSPADFALMQGYLDTGNTSTSLITVSGVKFPLYDVIVYCDGDNGDAARVGRYVLSGATSGNATKYVGDPAYSDFYGTYIEVDSPTGGASTPAGNYCRFRNVRGVGFTVSATGNYGSDNHPRAPVNALQIVPINVVPVLSEPVHSAGRFEFFLSGATNISYTIQGSTNLLDWDFVANRTAPAQVSLSSADHRYHFFRALFQ